MMGLRRPSFLKISLIASVLLLGSYLALRQYRYHESALMPDRDLIIDEAVELIRAHALQGSPSELSNMAATAKAMANDGGREPDLDRALRFLTARLYDDHSLYLPRGSAAQLTQAGEAAALPAIAASEPAIAGIPLLSVHAFMSLDASAGESAALHMRQVVDEALRGNRCGLLLDLSSNGGGNMYPMLAGLLPLLADGPLVVFESANKQRTAVTNSAGTLQYEGKPMVTLPASASAPWPGRIAVLTGPGTASSGEMVAIAFRGQANARSFGQPSAGINTGNTPFPLRHGGLLVLATSTSLDRNGHRYAGPIKPDESHPLKAGSSGARERAAAWVKASCSSSTGSPHAG